MRCPKCGQKVIAKAQGKRAAYHEDRETCQVIRQISPQELVVRIYKLYWSYAKGKDTIRKSAYEVMRIFVRSDNGKDATMEPYYYDSGYDSVTHWRYGYRPGALFGMACFSSEETGTVYLPGLEKALQGTPWEYCALRQFYEQTGIPMQVSYYLKMYLQHPLLVERLTKVGYKNIVSDVVYRNGFSDALDETQTKTHRILRVQKEDVSFLREKNADMAMLKKYQSYVAINLRGRKELFQWKIDNKVAEISTDVFRYMTAEKFMHYMEAQLPIYCDTRPANRYREPTMKTLVTMYVDYLHMRDEGETKLTPQEQSLNEEIEKLQDQWPYLMNEIFFIDYLKNPTYERGLAAKSKILVCFNDELLAAFLSAYKKANISEQQEMLTILKEISFRGGAVERDETDTEVTRKNLEKLENALNSEVEHTSDAVKKFYANRHLETVKQIRQKFLNTREM